MLRKYLCFILIFIILYSEKEVSAERASQRIADLEAALKQEQESKIQLNKIKNNALKEITTLKNQNRVANEVFMILQGVCMSSYISKRLFYYYLLIDKRFPRRRNTC